MYNNRALVQKNIGQFLFDTDWCQIQNEREENKRSWEDWSQNTEKAVGNNKSSLIEETEDRRSQISN